MKRQAIKIIIGILSVSLVGLAIIQAYWIRQNVRDLENRFDAQVYDVLQTTTEYLEREEEKRLKKKRLEFKDRTSSYNFGEIEKKELGLFETADFVKGLADKIDHIALGELMRKELQSRDINAEYHYGIYDLRLDAFVIIDDHYAIAENSNKSSPAFDPDEKADGFSRYKIYSRDFFGTVKKPDASIRIYFPQRTQFIWQTALPFLLVVFTFLLLILGCFIYTISVILRQKQVSEMKTDFINNMTHEFKTPIATISLATDSILSPKIIDSSEKVTRFAHIIKQENARMLSQVEKVLQMALIDKKEFELKLQPVDLHMLINKAVEHSNLKIEKREGKIEVNLEAKNAVIEGDTTHISNMIYNLLDNAEKYSPQAPHITISTQDRPNAVAISVKDRGIGLSSEAKKNIFDKFYRVHTGNLHDVKGFGLGLTYVKNLMTAHKGQIEVKSELNKGSKFTLVFPIKQNVR